MSRSQAERVYEALLTRIVRGVLGPGSRIVERDVADRLGVSRTPVRDAIRRLTTEGFLESTTDSTYDRPVVASLTGEDARDFHDFVIALESVVARRVAALPGEERVRIVQKMRAHNEEFRSLGERTPLDVAAILEADHAVHSAYIEAGAGTRLLALRAAVKPQLDRYVHNYGSALGVFVPEAAVEHEAIAAAIEVGDAETTGLAVMRNWENAARRLQNAITAGDRGDW